MRTLTIAVLSILALLVTIMLPDRSTPLDTFGEVEAAAPDVPALHAPQPTIPAPGAMAVSP